MPRRVHYDRRDPGTDARYNHPVVARFINKIMIDGKKGVVAGGPWHERGSDSVTPPARLG